MTDILFRTRDYVFSYRVAGIFIRNGNVLLQKPTNDTGYAFPGGHVEFGETNEETLIREFKEEIGVDIRVKELKWVAEIFFPWDHIPCHQICLSCIGTNRNGLLYLAARFMVQKERTEREETIPLWNRLRTKNRRANQINV